VVDPTHEPNLTLVTNGENLTFPIASVKEFGFVVKVRRDTRFTVHVEWKSDDHPSWVSFDKTTYSSRKFVIFRFNKHHLMVGKPYLEHGLEFWVEQGNAKMPVRAKYSSR
jgi:hypothetical protein